MLSRGITNFFVYCFYCRGGPIELRGCCNESQLVFRRLVREEWNTGKVSGRFRFRNIPGERCLLMSYIYFRALSLSREWNVFETVADFNSSRSRSSTARRFF